MKKIFIVSLLSFCYFNLSFGQRIDSQLEWINTNNTLSNSAVKAIVQDKLGFMWFGTSNGLFRYDGYNILHFKNEASDPNSLSNSLINALLIDGDDYIWIGTQNGGLNRLNLKTFEFTHYLHDTKNINSLASNAVNSLQKDNKGNLWIALRNGGIDRFEIQNNSFVHYKHKEDIETTISHDDVAALYNDENKNLWIGTWYAGLNCIDLSSETETFHNERYNTNFGKSTRSNAVISFTRLNNGNILFGTLYNGLFVIDKNKRIIKAELVYEWAKKVKDLSILSILETSKGLIYIGTAEGLILINPKDNSIKKYTNKYNLQGVGLKNNEIYTIYEDQTGVIWIGTKSGLNKISPKRFETLKCDANSLELVRNNVISIMEVSDKKFWIGTWGAGVFEYNMKTNESTQIFSTKNNSKFGNYIWNIYKDRSNRIWFGTYDNGFYNYDLNTGRFNFFENIPDIKKLQATCFYEDADKNFWIGTWQGLIKFDRKTNKLTWFKYEADNMNSITNNFVTAISGNKPGEIWVGTRYEGLNKLSFSKNSSSYKIFRYKISGNDSTTLNNAYISSLFVDSNDSLWIGTEGGGINRLTGTETFEQITETDGLPNNFIKSITQDKKGNIWVSTNNGLAVLNSNDKSVDTYNKSDGLQGNSFNPNTCYYTSNGYLIFGGTNGFNYFHPDSISVNKKLVKTIITDIKILNRSYKPYQKDDKGKILLTQSIEYTNDIKLEFRNNNFSFEFAALDFSTPEKNNYSYKLIGYDKDWIPASSNRRFATYTNLNPGNYQFAVKGTNSEGVWNHAATTLNITVKPPFWKTIWAILMYAVVLSSILFLIRKVLLDRARLQHNIQLAKLEREKDNEINQVKMNFFTNISHEFRTPLTLILAPLEELMSNKSSLHEKVKDKLSIMYRNAHRLLRLINQLMDFRKIETNTINLQLEETDVIKYVMEIATDFYNIGIQQNKNFLIETNTESTNGWIDKGKLEKIVFNLLSNAFKYTRAGGFIKLQVNIMNSSKNNSKDFIGNYLQLKFSDNGIGIKHNELDKIFEPFYRSHQLEKNQRIGTGIGLSLVNEFVKIHKGKINVSSISDQGSCFTIEIPLDKENYSSEQFLSKNINEQPFLKPDAEIFESKKEKEEILDSEKTGSLLIIEDNEEVNNYIKDSLQIVYSILQAKDGKEGLQMAYKHIPDLIICDIMMPEMDGIEVTRNLKSDIRTSHIPVIMLTAKSSLEQQLQGIEVGADAYITKPFNHKHLETNIRKLIESRAILRERFSNDIAINPADLQVSSIDENFLQRAIDITNQYLSDENFSIEQFGNEMLLSRSQLHRKIKALTNQTPTEFVRTIRLKRAAQMLSANKLPISDIAYKTGFNSPAYFTKCFKSQFGIVPTEYIDKFGANHEK